MKKSIIVIGGGVIGLSCAFKLAQKGLQVTIVEKGKCGERATTASLGVLMPYMPTIEKPTAILQRTSLDMYEEFAKEITEFSGIDIEFEKTGHLQVLHSEKQFEKAKKAVEKANQDNISINGQPSFELLTFEQAKQLEPNLVEAKFGCMYSRSTGNLSTEKLVLALKTCCEKLNVTILENTEVVDILIKDKTVSQIKLNTQETLQADNTLIATGAYSNVFKHIIPNLGEILSQKGEAIELQLEERKFDRLIKMAGFYAVCKKDGTTFIGSTTSRKPDFSEHVSEKSIKLLLKGGQKIIPNIKQEHIKRAWAGHRPHSYLGSPLLGKCEEAKNLFVATGHGKIGICTAPFTAKIISNLIADDNQIIDLKPFNVNKLKQPGSKD